MTINLSVTSLHQSPILTTELSFQLFVMLSCLCKRVNMGQDYVREASLQKPMPNMARDASIDKGERQ